MCLTLCNPVDCSPPGSSVPRDSPGKDTGVGCHALLQGIFPTQGSNPGPRHCRKILYCLSHQGSPRILEWVAYPFSRRSSRPRNHTRVTCIAGRQILYQLSYQGSPRISIRYFCLLMTSNLSSHPPEFQTGISNCLLCILTQRLYRH